VLHEAGAREISLDYVVVDTLLVDRTTFASNLDARRDGSAHVIAQHSRMRLEEAVAHFDDIIVCIRNPAGYAVWLVPVLAAVTPGGTA
jgi:hypothetical protein